MKLQIQEQSVRLRVDEAELARLLSGETLVNSTRHGADPGAHFSQHLSLRAGAVATLQVADGEWQFALPDLTVRDYVARLPCRQALQFELEQGDGIVVAVAFEVDVRDSLQVRGAKRRDRDADVSAPAGITPS